MNWVFYTSASIAVLSTLLAMVSRHAVHALLYFVLSTLALGIIIYDFGAPFAAALEVLIYAGAIMVLFVFVVMLINPSRDLSRKSLWIPTLLTIGLLVEMLYSHPGNGDFLVKKTPQFWIVLFKDYGVLVELTSFVLLAGLLVAYRIGKK